jgi:hypothetical protein
MVPSPSSMSSVALRLPASPGRNNVDAEPAPAAATGPSRIRQHQEVTASLSARVRPLVSATAPLLVTFTVIGVGVVPPPPPGIVWIETEPVCPLPRSVAVADTLASDFTTNVAAREPAPAGWNVAFTVHVPPPGTTALPQVSGSMANSPARLPVDATDVIVCG